MWSVRAWPGVTLRLKINSPQQYLAHPFSNGTPPGDNHSGRNSMRKFQVLLFSLLVGVSTAMQSQEKSDVIRLDPALDEIVSADAKVEKLAGNLVATNGPLW